jgi:hypothetical protein
MSTMLDKNPSRKPSMMLLTSMPSTAFSLIVLIVAFFVYFAPGGKHFCLRNLFDCFPVLAIQTVVGLK